MSDWRLRHKTRDRSQRSQEVATATVALGVISSLGGRNGFTNHLCRCSVERREQKDHCCYWNTKILPYQNGRRNQKVCSYVGMLNSSKFETRTCNLWNIWPVIFYFWLQSQSTCNCQSYPVTTLTFLSKRSGCQSLGWQMQLPSDFSWGNHRTTKAKSLSLNDKYLHYGFN